MKIKVRCCVADCPDYSEWHILDYLYTVLVTRSLKPYVCVNHHHLFDDVDMSDYDPVKHDEATDTAHTLEPFDSLPEEFPENQSFGEQETFR